MRETPVHNARGWATVLLILVAGLAAVAALRVRMKESLPEAEPTANVDAESEDTPPVSEIKLSHRGIVRSAGIEVEPVQVIKVEHRIRAAGIADFNRNRYVKVPPKAAGIVREVLIDVGAEVQAGDVLCSVDSQTIGDLKATLIKAQVHEEHSRWQIERYRDAAAGVAAKNLLEAQHMLEEELTDKRRIIERLTEFGLSREEIDRSVREKDSSVRLVILAPRGGTVVERHAVEGAGVDADSPLVAIADLDTMWIQLNIAESDLPQITLNQTVEFRPDGLPRSSFTGKVTWISPALDPRSRLLPVRAEVGNRDGALKANMFGRGELSGGAATERTMVPASAVQTFSGRPVVFVRQSDDLFSVRYVEIGLKQKDRWEVVTGLEPGEFVATTGSFLLKSNLENPDFGKVK